MSGEGQDMNGAMDSGRERGQHSGDDGDEVGGAGPGRARGEHHEDELDAARTMDDATRVAAYVDDEMDAAERARFEARLAEDATLVAAVARERRLRARLAQTFDPVLAEPVPERLSALFANHEAVTEPAPAAAPGPSAKPDTKPIDLGEERRRRRGGWLTWGGMAASLALGVLIGTTWLAPRGALEVAADGGWLAEGALAQALDAQLSGAAAPGSSTRVGLSFVSRDGRYCRAFTVGGADAGGATAGLACRGDDAWRVRQLATITAGSASASPTASTSAASEAFRMAASPWPQALLDDMDRLREGDPLSSADERDAMRRDWRR
jgi:hypothetical protein